MLSPQNHRRHVLSSLHYPYKYPANLECVWKLIAPKGYTIRLTFHDFDVEWDQNCEYDFLDIYLLNMHSEAIRYKSIAYKSHDESFSEYLHTNMMWHSIYTYSQKHLCGSHLPGVTTTNESTSNTAVVRFHSDGSYSRKGFLLAYELQGMIYSW